MWCVCGWMGGWMGVRSSCCLNTDRSLGPWCLCARYSVTAGSMVKESVWTLPIHWNHTLSYIKIVRCPYTEIRLSLTLKSHIVRTPKSHIVLQRNHTLSVRCSHMLSYIEIKRCPYTEIIHCPTVKSYVVRTQKLYIILHWNRTLSVHWNQMLSVHRNHTLPMHWNHTLFFIESHIVPQ